MDFFLKNSIISIFLRSITLLSRFLLVLFIGKYLSVDELGIFGIFFSAIIFSTFLIGYDFYTYRTREILSDRCDNKAIMIRDQFIFYIIMYVVLFPFFSLLFFNNILPFDYILFFYFLLIIEHISQELFRLLIVLSKPIKANIILFVRSGLWVFILFILFYFGFIVPNLKLIFLFWAIGGLVSIFLGIIVLYTSNFGSINKNVNWQWIKRGFIVATPFFISTIAYKIIEYSNRLFINIYLSNSELGIFTFCINLSNTVQTLIMTGIIMLIYPKMVETYASDSVSFNKHYLNLKKYTIIFSIFFSIIVIIIYPFVVMIVDRQELNNNFYLFIILLLSSNIFNFSLIFHYNLYVMNKDKEIMYITISAAITNLLLNYILIKPFGLIGIAMSLFLSYIQILILKMLYNRKINNIIITNS